MAKPEKRVRDGRVRWLARYRTPDGIRTTEMRFLTHAQVEELAEACGTDYRLLVRFLCYTGLRWGEAAALRIGRVDFLRRRVLVAESVTPVKGVMTWGPTKGHERREVPVPLFLVEQLAAHVAGRAADDLLFPGPRGGVARAQTFQRAALTKAAEKIGMPGFHPHECRHTAASLAIAAGANIKVIQLMLGHKSASMTLDQYGWLYGDQLDIVAEAMDAARASALAEKAKLGADVYQLGNGAEVVPLAAAVN